MVTLRKIGSLIRLNPQEIEFHPMVAAAVSHALHYMATFSVSMKKRIIEGGLVPVLFRALESDAVALQPVRKGVCAHHKCR